MNNSDSISIVLPVYNCETTILLCLKSIFKQDYPIKEIVMVDNHSSDKTIQVIEGIQKKYKKIPMQLVKRDKSYRVADSYNLGAELAKGKYIVLMHSDCMLPTDQELRKLMAPFIKDPSIDLSAPYVVLPMSIWKKYNFWQKYLFANMVDVKIPSGNGQFECVKRETFLKIGGYDVKNFGGRDIIGGEDADFHTRLRKIGKVVLSDALVLHIHYIGKNFSLADVLKSKRVNARSYGRFVKIQGKSMSIISLSIFLSKFLLAILPLIPYLSFVGTPLLLIYSFYYSRKLFFQRPSLTDPKIVLVPFLNIFLVYHDAFWMAEAFLYKKKVVR
ncbi:MAG: glycosyltransferase family 2 protein [Candidatus Parcubacteria bacterium]|nr:glycosyltransferase family 2 protein [Candidatus Parcubacteria bacterium]